MTSRGSLPMQRELAVVAAAKFFTPSLTRLCSDREHANWRQFFALGAGLA
jgi:hypothetical protein